MPGKIELNKEQTKLFNELKKLSKRANQRILRIERKYGKESWAIKSLKEKLASQPLQAWSRSGRIRVYKQMSEDQLIATLKATQNFLSKPTSTLKGIAKARKSAINTLKINFSSFETGALTMKEAEALYNLFEDKSVNQITNYIKGSDILALIETAKEQNMEYKEFYDMINLYITYNKGKDNLEQILRTIYNKYVYTDKTDNFENLFDNTKELITGVNTMSDLEDIESIIENLLYENRINEKEYNTLINLLDDKKKEL